MDKIFTVSGEQAKVIMREYGHWVHYDLGFPQVSLSIRGTRGYPIPHSLMDPLNWLPCDSNYTKYNGEIRNDGIYEMKIQHGHLDYLTQAFSALRMPTAQNWGSK